MLQSLYTAACDLYSTTPDYAIYDMATTAWTIFELCVAVSARFALQTRASKMKPHHHKVAKFYRNIPIMVNGMALLAMTVVNVQLAWWAHNDPNDIAITSRAVWCLETLICSLIVQKLSGVDVDVTTKVEEQEVRQPYYDIKNWKPPVVAKWFNHIIAPFRWIMRPEFHGTENIPTTNQPGLYVMNHALYAHEGVPFMASLYHMKNVYLRGLADRSLFGPVMGDLVHYFGAVNGTRDNVDALMENRDNILVYPGGNHECMRSCAVPNYTLMWKQRLGFARMAIKHGYPIIPCASVGTEDMQDRLFDLNLEFVRKGLTPPVVMVWPHKLQKVYYWIGEPIPTAQYNGDYNSDEFAKEVRDKAKAAIEAGIQEMQERQANDPNRFLFNHMANIIVGLWRDPFATTKRITS